MVIASKMAILENDTSVLSSFGSSYNGVYILSEL